MTVDTRPEYLLRSHPKEIDAGIAEIVVELSKEQPKISPGFDLGRRLLSYYQLTTGETVISSFKAGRYLQSELQARANPYLPTIGIEVESDKNPAREASGRVELTPLGFGNSASYRQLYLIQQLGAAFFAYEKSTMGAQLDQKEEVLATSWRIVQDHLAVIFDRANLNSDVFGNPNSREQFRSIIQNSGLVKHLKVLIPALISHIRLVLKGDITEVYTEL